MDTRSLIDHIEKKQKLNIKNPGTIQDKIAWLKVHDNIPLKSLCSDKLAVRLYVKEKLGQDVSVPLVKIFKSFKDISPEVLPDSFVIKCSHGSGYNVVVKDKRAADFESIRKKVEAWLKEDYSLRGYEPQYKNVPHICFAEKYLGDGANIEDFKFWCFNGVPKFFTVNGDISIDKYPITFYDLSGNLLPYSRNDHPSSQLPLECDSSMLERMIDCARILSSDFKFVRVDLLVVDRREYYFGELTFTPGNGNFRYETPGLDVLIGDMLKL